MLEHSWSQRRKKWNAIRDKIAETNCDIISLQEIKRESFDTHFIKNFCPRDFDSFEFLPSLGASGGVITIWKSHLFSGQLVFSNDFGTSVEFVSCLDAITWVLTNIYAPCTPAGKLQFIDWLKNIQMPDEVNWLLIGYFNLIRSLDDRNRPGGDVNEIFLFNEAISSLGIVELPLQGQRFTWTNKQHPLSWKD